MYIVRKRVKGRKYWYLVKSIRLPDSSVVKLEKIISKPGNIGTLGAMHAKFFEKAELNAHVRWALKRWKTSKTFTKEQIAKIEAMRLGYRKIVKTLGKNDLKDMLDRFTANFTYESNAIEGNSMTLKDVALVMFEGRAVPGKELREIYETRNSRPVVEQMFRRRFKVDHTGIIKMHKLLMHDIDDRLGYKKVPNYLLGRRVETTPPERVKAEMDALLKWYEKAVGCTHPLEAAAMFHGRFERIHPFADGNGRVGRFLINVILVNNGLPPLIIRRTQRTAYFAVLDAFDGNYQDKLKKFMLEKFKETYKKFFEVYARYV